MTITTTSSSNQPILQQRISTVPFEGSSPIIPTSLSELKNTQLTPTPTSCAEEYNDERAFNEELVSLKDATRKRSKAKELFEYLCAKKIKSVQQWDALPLDEKAEFCMMPNFGVLLNQACSTILQSTRLERLEFNILDIPLERQLELKDDTPKIVHLLQYQGWTLQRILFFRNIVQAVINRDTKKKNCVWLYGKSNSGKTQLMQSFVDSFFHGQYGIPTNNVKSSFMFGNCNYKRLIFWEEPVINELNIETVKNMFSGGHFSVDVKYEKNVIIQPTPVLVTSNFSPKNGLSSEAGETIDNRVFGFYFGKKCLEDCDWFPFVKTDWLEYVFWCTGKSV